MSLLEGLGSLGQAFACSIRNEVTAQRMGSAHGSELQSLAQAGKCDPSRKILEMGGVAFLSGIVYCGRDDRAWRQHLRQTCAGLCGEYWHSLDPDIKVHNTAVPGNRVYKCRIFQNNESNQSPIPRWEPVSP